MPIAINVGGIEVHALADGAVQSLQGFLIIGLPHEPRDRPNVLRTVILDVILINAILVN